MSMTPQQIAAEISVFAQAVTPFLPPGIQLAVTLAINAMKAVQAAQNSGADVTPEQLEALFAADDQAKADNLQAEQERILAGDTSGQQTP